MIRPIAAALSLLVATILLPDIAAAQGAALDFGDGDHDSSAPIEVTSDQLDVDQSAGTAIFTGNVVVVQADMRLAAERLVVEYVETEGSTEIERIRASGGVTLVNDGQAAEADEAVYSVASGDVLMTGSVLVAQGPQAVSGDRLRVDLATGQGRVEGRVRTILQSGGN